MKNVAILALQGAFAEHRRTLALMGVESTLIRNLADWRNYLGGEAEKGLIIPGGESTTMTRLLRDLGMREAVREAIIGGLPTFGTCAGLILLDGKHLDVMRITARRNAYGRQLGSFRTMGDFAGKRVPMTFIRAPYIEKAEEGVETLSEVDGRTVAARQGRMLVTAFHPELDDDPTVHRYFLNLF